MSPTRVSASFIACALSCREKSTKGSFLNSPCGERGRMTVGSATVAITFQFIAFSGAPPAGPQVGEQRQILSFRISAGFCLKTYTLLELIGHSGGDDWIEPDV